MKTKSYITALCICGALTLSACSGSQKKTDTAIPSEIQNVISQKYPQANILDSDQETDGTTEVEIKDKDKKKDVWFNRTYQWMSTHWDVNTEEVPPALMDALTTSAYASYKIDDIEAIENPNGLFYEFKLSKDNNTVHVTMDQFAQVVQQETTTLN